VRQQERWLHGARQALTASEAVAQAWIEQSLMYADDLLASVTQMQRVRVCCFGIVLTTRLRAELLLVADQLFLCLNFSTSLATFDTLSTNGTTSKSPY